VLHRAWSPWWGGQARCVVMPHGHLAKKPKRLQRQMNNALLITGFAVFAGVVAVIVALLTEGRVSAII
jgi:hypothetical protein